MVKPHHNNKNAKIIIVELKKNIQKTLEYSSIESLHLAISRCANVKIPNVARIIKRDDNDVV